MRKIYTGIDIGSDSIKVVVSEIFNNKFHVLASTSVPNNGTRKGIIVDKPSVVASLKKAISEIESTIGLRIEEAVVTVPSNDRKLSVAEGSCDILGGIVTGEDVVNCLSSAIVDKIDDDYELVTTIPIAFSIVNIFYIIDPKV